MYFFSTNLKVGRGERLFALFLSYLVGAFSFSDSVFADTNSDYSLSKDLTSALQAVIQNHPQIQAQQAQVHAQQDTIRAEKSAYLPSLSSRMNSAIEGNNLTTVNLNQPLYTFGRISNQVKRAKTNHQVEEAVLLSTQRDLLEQTAVAYARISGLRAQIKTADNNVSEHQQLYQRIQKRHQGKLASLTDVKLTYGRLIQAQATLQRLRSELQSAKQILRSLTQVEVNSDTHVLIDEAFLPLDTPFPTLALERSADILVEKLRVKAVQTEAKQATLDALPTVALQVSYSHSNNDDYMNDYGDDTAVGIVLESQLNGFGVSNYYRKKSENNRIRAAEQSLKSVKNEVKYRVSNLTLNRQLQSANLRSQQLAIEATTATLDSFYRQYETGRKSYLELLNTQRELNTLRLDLHRQQTEWEVISLQLAAILGQLDEVAGLPLPQ